MELQDKESLTFKEMLHRSPCSIAVIIAFIISDYLITKGIIQDSERLILPWVTVTITALWVISIVIRNKFKVNV